MDDEFLKLSVSQFAELHGVNKRTLHYYDKVGIFVPAFKESNHYRYYSHTQSIAFENIRMLRELNMSIDEIKQYLANPGIDAFMQIADFKIKELNEAAEKLERAKHILEKKKQQLEFCKTINPGEIQVVDRKEEYLISTVFSSSQNKIREMMAHLKKVWEIEQYKVGCGSFISLEKIREKQFETYDGVYTPIHKKATDPNFALLPCGTYICIYHVGKWDELPSVYEKILKFADRNKLHLIGNAYEIGLNEIAVKNKKDYITRILTQVE